MPVEKAPWATYSLAVDLQALILGYSPGFERICQMNVMEEDPLLTLRLGVSKLPHISTLYHSLERFQPASDVFALGKVNDRLLEKIVPAGRAILDLDTTVETVYGSEKNATGAYNPHYRDRPSYQPFVAFEGRSKAAVSCLLRSGATPTAKEKIAFYTQCKEACPAGTSVALSRADAGFPGEDFFAVLEEDGVGYTIKSRMTLGLRKRLDLGVSWERIHYDENLIIEVASVKFTAHGWSRPRHVVLVRTKPPRLEDPQGNLFPDHEWEYQVIVTNLPWAPEDIWHFYNQRCTAENYIKELKYGLNADVISKQGLWPNAADLWLKITAYNCLIGWRRFLPATYRPYTISRLRRALLLLPAVLVRHARKWKLRLPSYWPHKHAWAHARLALNTS